MSNYINLTLLLVYIILNGCTSAHNIVSTVELNDLVHYCDNIENELSVNTILLSNPNDQERFFGSEIDEKVFPILACYNNNTDKDYGLNADEIKIRVSEKVIENGHSRETPSGDVGTYLTLASFVGGTALLGVFPGIVIVAVAGQGAASASAQVAIDMQNKKLQSGVLKSNTKKAGFLFIQDDNNYISKNAVNATIETNLLMVPSKKPIILISKLETYN